MSGDYAKVAVSNDKDRLPPVTAQSMEAPNK